MYDLKVFFSFLGLAIDLPDHAFPFAGLKFFWARN